MIVIRDSKTFCFNFDWSKYVDDNLKREIEFVIKSYQLLAENKIKKEIGQFGKEIGNNIHEHGKQQNEWTKKICS